MQNHIYSFLFFRKLLKQRIILILCCLCATPAISQQITITGKVTDSKTGEAIPYVNIVVKGTISGTITDTLGNYRLDTNVDKGTLRYSAIGYYPEEKKISSSKRTEISVKLKPETIDIGEVEVAPDEGPIRLLLRNIISHKHLNDPDQLQKFSYRKYTKWKYQINNVSDKIIKSKAFKNDQDVFKSAEDSSKYLPLYFSEQLVFNQVQKNPAKQKSTILADKTNGVGILNNLEIAGYTSALDMEVNFYNNFILLFSQNFVSPISDNGWFYYKYFLADSTNINGLKRYRVNFQPRRTGENTFKGYFIVETNHFSIEEIEGRLSNTNNINFLTDMKLKSNYAFVDDTIPFYKRNQIDALFLVIPYKTKKKDQDRLSVFYTQIANIDHVNVNPTEEIKLSNKKSKYETVKLANALDHDSAFWKKNRPEKLTINDHLITQTIDSVSNVRTISILNNLARMAMNSYYDIGKIELGPYTSFVNTNKVEGLHLFMGARTSSEISKNKMVWAGLGYGTKNKKINGIAGFGYKFNNSNREILKLSFEDQMTRFGESEEILNLYENAFTTTENNLVSQMLKRDELTEIFRQQKIKGIWEKEWYPGLTNKISANYTKHFSPTYFPFYNKKTGDPVKSVSSAELMIDTRFSKEEKYIDDGFFRFYMETDYPIVHFTFGGGKTYYDDTSNWFGKLNLTIKQYVYLGQSFINYAIESGIYFGKVPYSMLNIPRGNETIGYYQYDFNMLNYLEYVHDKYLHIYLDYHLNGFFFRRLPILKKTDLREVMSAKLMMGSLSDKQKNVITLPSEVSDLHNPYIEVGAGIENIFKFARVEAIWRVHPSSTTEIGAPTFGIRALFMITM